MIMLWLAVLLLCVVVLGSFHLTNPYARITVFKKPYSAIANAQGDIDYIEHYRLKVYGGKLADALGYVKAGFLIVQNTFFGSRPAEGDTVEEIIAYIHHKRFDHRLPYLISGDQYSILYPRNLGVFYNQILDPNTAHSQKDWENRQQIYMQSVLVAIDGLSATTDPRTTVVPIGRKSAVLTQVHPGGVGSDQVYGLFYALSQLQTPMRSDDGVYKRRTSKAARRIVQERQTQLQFIYDSYLQVVYNPSTQLVHQDLHLSSARDGVIRSGSLYDNIILYETMCLAESLGLESKIAINHDKTKKRIKDFFWNAKGGYYNDDAHNHNFSSDWLIGYVTGFFDMSNKLDLQRTLRTIDYIEASGLAEPLPIKYQTEGNGRVPYFVRQFLPNYGLTAIWSYWGAQYITLLADVYEQTRNEFYYERAVEYVHRYETRIVRDAGFAETFDSKGDFLRTRIYKSIRITGWVVQFEHATYKLHRLAARDSLKPLGDK